MDLTDFVRESNRIEGITRAPTHAELKEHAAFLNEDVITVISLQRLVDIIQPGGKLRDREDLNVRVGNHIAPPGGPLVVHDLEAILACAPRAGAYETHLAYETLHPFTDGNGRSGRALWLWQMGGDTSLGFLHRFYYQTLANQRTGEDTEQ